MDTVRTTISIPEELHNRLRLESVRKRKSLGSLISEKYGYNNRNEKQGSNNDELEKDMKLFSRIASVSKKYDAVKAIREERDRDNG